MHLSAAVEQRRTMSLFVKRYVGLLDNYQNLSNEILPDYIDSSTVVDSLIEGTEEQSFELPNKSVEFELCQNITNDTEEVNQVQRDTINGIVLNDVGPTVLIQAEDFGGSLALPHYGFSRPSADYFNSNLLLQNFVIANINDQKNYVLFYDERGQDKGADSLCSLRIMYHLMQWIHYSIKLHRPDCSLSILDNCVGQNKSNVVMKFNAMLSLLFYKKVVLLFLIPGHSHMIADRVIAWCRAAIRGFNLYTPQEIVQKCNTVNSVEAKFLDHTDSHRPFYCKWDAILNKYFLNLPIGYISNYLFEFAEGVVTMRHIISTPDDQAVNFQMLRQPENIDIVRRALLQEIFGITSMEQISAHTISSLCLPRHQGNQLTAKKIKSLQKKYFSIPKEFLSYYPSTSKNTLPVHNMNNDGFSVAENKDDYCSDNDNSNSSLLLPANTKVKTRKLSQVEKHIPGTKQLGRPKKIPKLDNRQQSILSFFSTTSP